MKKLLIILSVIILAFSIPAYTFADSDKSVEQEKGTKANKAEKKDKKNKKTKKKNKKKKKRNRAKEKEALEKCVDKTILDAQKVVDKYHYECRILNYEGNDYTSFMSYGSDEDKEKWTVILVSEIDTVKKTVTMSIDCQQEQEARQKAKEEEERKKAEEEAAAAAAAAAAKAQAAQEETVWVPRTGHKYHNNPNCSNMKNPTPMPRSQAEKSYDPCSKCYR